MCIVTPMCNDVYENDDIATQCSYIASIYQIACPYVVYVTQIVAQCFKM